MISDKNINGLLAVFFVILTLGILFHQDDTFAGSVAGHSIGITGTVLMFMTLIYPFKKRILGKRGSKNPLSTHIFYGLLGPSLVVIHSAHKLGSLIALLTFLTMLIVVLSGITGKFLFRRVSRTLNEQQKELNTLKESFYERKKEAAGCKDFLKIEDKKERNGSEESKDDEKQMEECYQLIDMAKSISELEYSTTFFDSTKVLFSKWMKLHHFLTFFLFSFIILHVLTVLYYGLRWIK